MIKFLCVLMFCFKHSTRNTAVAYSFLRYFLTGKEYGFPTCCVIHFSWDVSRPKLSCYPAKERGAIFRDPDDRNDCYVPCKFHMRRNPNWRAWAEDENLRQLRLFTMEPKK